MANWLTLIIIGLVALIIAYYLNRAGAPDHPPIVRWFIGLIGAVCLIVGLVLFVLWIAGVGGATSPPRAGAAPLLGLLFLGSVNPAPTPAPADNGAAFAFVWRYALNAALVLLTILSVIATYITTAQITGSWLGLGDIQWHWVLAVFGGATALNAAFNRTPPITHFPTQARLDAERHAHAMLQ